MPRMSRRGRASAQRQCSYVSALGSEQVVETLRASSFRFQDVYDGKPLSIYIVIPPDKLESIKRCCGFGSVRC